MAISGAGELIILPIREMGQCGGDRGVFRSTGESCVGRTGLEEPVLGSFPARMAFGMGNAAADGH